MPERPNLDQGHGVRFEKVITRHIKRLAEASHLTYSEMTRVLVDEAILARLTRTDLDRDVLREAVFHAIAHQPKSEYTYTMRVDLGEPETLTTNDLGIEEPVRPLTEMLIRGATHNAQFLQELTQRALDESDPEAGKIKIDLTDLEEAEGWD